MIYPDKLKKGDKVGIVSPSSPTPKEKIEASFKVISDMGFVPVPGESCYLDTYGEKNYLSGSDEVRAEDINRMFGDPDIKGVWCIRGGYGAARILDRLDYTTIRNNPKVFVGYSDITVLHTVFNGMCNFSTIHGPMPSTDLLNASSYTWDSLNAALNYTGEELRELKNPEGEEMEFFSPGTAEGILTGGCLSLLVSTLGSPYEVDTKGKILFLEDTDEEPYRIDSFMTTLKNAGKLEDAAGFAVGTWSNCMYRDGRKSILTEDLLKEMILPYGKPSVFNVRGGHTKPVVSLNLGADFKIDSTEKRIFTGRGVK